MPSSIHIHVREAENYNWTCQTHHYKTNLIASFRGPLLHVDQPINYVSMVIPFHQLVRPMGGSPTFNPRPTPFIVFNVFLMQLYNYYDFLDIFVTYKYTCTSSLNRNAYFVLLLLMIICVLIYVYQRP